MAYFDGVKTGDKVWHFEYGWGKVKNLLKASDLDNQNFNINNDFGLIEVNFDNIYFGCGFFDFDGVAFYSNGNQTLFWDEVKFEIPKPPKIKLKEDVFIIQPEWGYIEPTHLFENKAVKDAIKNGLTRDDKEIAEKVLGQVGRFARLLALRDQECPDSREYEFVEGGNNWTIKKDSFAEKNNGQWVTSITNYYYFPDRVYFATEEDAQRICDILNSGRFDLEGE